MTTENVDTTSQTARKKGRPALVVAIILVMVLILGAAGAFAWNQVAAQQRKENLEQVKNDHLNALSDARNKIQPAANAYLAAYKKARNAPASRDEAVQNSKKEQDDFQQALQAARSALEKVEVPGSAGEAVGVAARQLKESHEAYFQYMEGLVQSYPQFEGLFRKDDAAGCEGLFVGSKAGTLRERQTLLAQAAAPCRQAIGELRKSGNEAYVEFARTLDNRVAELETNAEATAKGEESYDGFVKLKDEFVRKADDAEARNAPTEEVLKIADDARKLNSQIRANRSEFDFAAKRYLAGVKELPDLVEQVFSKDVTADIQHYSSVIPLREQVLKDSIDVELVE